MSVNHPSIFIIHGNKHPKVLDRIKTFLSELGVTPVIAEEQPSMALPPEEKVRYFMDLCDSVLVLATPDDLVTEQGRSYKRPRQNVIFEIPIAKELRPGKIIYMKEKTTEFPSDLTPPTYIPFRLTRLDDALIQLIRELKGLQLFRTVHWDEEEQHEQDLLTAAREAGILSVEVNKARFNAKEIIAIMGTVPAVLEGLPVAIQLFNPRNTMHTIDQVTPNADGTYSTTIRIGGKLGLDGIYTVKATYAGQSVQTTFEFKGESKSE